MVGFRFAGRASWALVTSLLATSPACSQEHAPASSAQEPPTAHLSAESRVAEQLVHGLFRIALGEQWSFAEGRAICR